MLIDVEDDEERDGEMDDVHGGEDGSTRGVSPQWAMKTRGEQGHENRRGVSGEDHEEDSSDSDEDDSQQSSKIASNLEVPVVVDDANLSKNHRLLRALAKRSVDRQLRDVDEICDALKNITDPFIANLEESVKRAICQRLTLDEFEAGDLVFELGATGDKFYMIYTGRVLIEVPQFDPAGQDDLDDVNPATEFLKLHFDSGKAFGQLALMSTENRRNARVTAAKACQMLALSREDYQWCIGFSQQNFVRERVEFLKSVDRAMLDGVKEVDLSAMAGFLAEEQFTGAQVVLKQGAELDKVIFVKSGFCKVLRALHPKYKEAFHVYADRGKPPPNPFEPDGSDDAKGGDLKLQSRPALEKLLRRYKNVQEESPTGRHNTTTSVRSLASEAQRPGALQPVTTPPPSVPRGENSPSARPRLDSMALATHGGGTDLSLALTTPMGRTPGSASTVADREDADAVDANSSQEVVVVDVLKQGRSFGIMEMMEGLTYQCSVVADPWCEVYVISKYDLVSNTSKIILHRLFCDYKTRLGDDRLMRRLQQKGKWNNYKRGLLDEIKNRKRTAQSNVVDRGQSARRNGGGDMAIDDCKRVGKNEKLWDKRAQTPPRKTYTNKNGAEVQHIFRVHCQRSEAGVPDVKVEREVRDASMVALDEKIVLTIATARFRDKFRRENKPGKGSSSTRASYGKDCASAPKESPSPSTPVGVGEATPSGNAPPNSARTPRNRQGFVARTLRKGTLTDHLHPVVQAQELEDRAKQAAQDYLEQRNSRIEAIREKAKSRMVNDSHSRISYMVRSHQRRQASTGDDSRQLAARLTSTDGSRQATADPAKLRDGAESSAGSPRSQRVPQSPRFKRDEDAVVYGSQQQPDRQTAEQQVRQQSDRQTSSEARTASKGVQLPRVTRVRVDK